MLSLMRSSHLALRLFVKAKRRSYELGCILLPLERNHQFHTGQYVFKEKKNEKKDEEKNALMVFVFENVDEKKKETFLDILRIYEKETIRRADLTFIKLALKYMKAFGVHKDLECYKAIFNILPKGPYVAKNYYQAVFRHYPKHQDVATEVLEEMENNRVIPDRELETILINIFGKHAIPLKKLWRMLYWMPKFAHLNPWPVPRPVPTDPKVLARIAINKISSIDVTRTISEFNIADVQEGEECLEETWIISAMSPIQKDLLIQHYKLRKDKAIYVEGPWKVWVADQSVDYFVLRGDPVRTPEENKNIDDVSNLEIPFWKTEVIVEPTVHEQEDGIYFAVCATGTSSKNSAASWIRCLQKDNPVLNEIPVLIKLSSLVDKECIEIKDIENKSIN